MTNEEQEEDVDVDEASSAKDGCVRVVVLVTSKNMQSLTHGISRQKNRMGRTFPSHDEFIEKTRPSRKGHKL